MAKISSIYTRTRYTLPYFELGFLGLLLVNTHRACVKGKSVIFLVKRSAYSENISIKLIESFS